jgi:hypothetical protein
MIFVFIIINLLFVSLPTDPVELGKVHWLRSMDEAMEKSKRECKPILILFQEVPGCQTCRQYGSEVLSHPLIVESIETNFIPLAIFNNKGGHDGEILKRYNEPAWNNPVVRIVDDKGKDLVSRLSGNYSAQGLTDLMTTVLIKSQGKAPLYMQLMADEFAAKAKGTNTVTYTMYCFWTGEALFGKLNGVIATTAGWQSGKEVVKVEYNPSVISKSQLDKVAEQSKCKISPAGNFAIDKTPKYYLYNHTYRSIPMLEIQKARVNSAIAEGQNPEMYLSSRQLGFLKRQSKENFVNVPLMEAWRDVGL